MTSFSRPSRRDYVAADEFEARVERAFIRAETVFVVDGEMVMRVQDGCIETSDEF